MTEFSDFMKAMVAHVEGVEAQKKAAARLEKKNAQLAAERERRRINYMFDQRRVEREQQLRARAAAEERRRQREQALLEDEEAQARANGAFLIFMTKREALLEDFDEAKSTMINDTIRNPWMEDFYVALTQKMGDSAATLSDVFRINERKCLKKLMDDFLEESNMSLRARRYFMGMAAPLLLPRPRREVDDVVDLMRIMARSYN